MKDETETLEKRLEDFKRDFGGPALCALAVQLGNEVLDLKRQLKAKDAETAKFNKDLEGREFYELCQMYRHAKDVADPCRPIGAARAFELLKAWLKGDDSDPVLQHIAESYRGM